MTSGSGARAPRNGSAGQPAAVPMPKPGESRSVPTLWSLHELARYARVEHRAVKNWPSRYPRAQGQRLAWPQALTYGSEGQPFRLYFATDLIAWHASYRRWQGRLDLVEPRLLVGDGEQARQPDLRALRRPQQRAALAQPRARVTARVDPDAPAKGRGRAR